MIALLSIFGLGLLPLISAVDRLAVRDESVSMSVTVTVDWLYPPVPTEYPSEPEPTSSTSASSWEGWSPPETYYPPPPDPYSTSTSTGDDGGCQPHTSHWPNTSSTPVVTLVTTRPVIITTFTTEVWTTVVGEVVVSSPSSYSLPETETEELAYPMPTWTRCPYASGEFHCGDMSDNNDGGADAAIAVEVRDGKDSEGETESLVEDDAQPQETGTLVSSARGMTDGVIGFLWLVAGVMAAVL